jgi:peptidoglycan/xylan/chitin deacetylase (PgdA/CDA1 family)
MAAKAIHKRLPPGVRAFLRRLVAASAGGVGTITHVETREPVVALTFDDGPDPTWTPRLLDVLAAVGARATFFMVGKAAARHRGLVERVAGEGHAIANHSWDHPSFPLLRGRARRAQLRWCQEALAPWGERLFRPPWGHQTPATHLGALLLGYRVVTWSVTAADWLDRGPEELLDDLRERLQPGAIAVLHDALYATNDARYRDREPTVRAVERLLEEYGGRFRFVTVPELLRTGRPRRWHWYRRSDLDWLREQI